MQSLGKRIRSSVGGWIYLLPALALFTVFSFYPLIYGMNLSLYRIPISLEKWEFVGILNYAETIRDPLFLNALKNNFIFLGLVLIIRTAIGFLLAFFLNKGFRTVGFLRIVYLLPYTLSMVVVGMLWARIYDPFSGVLSLSLQRIGLDSLTRNWLGDGSIALLCVCLIFIWKSFGFPMLIFLIALGAISPAIEEAAEIDGASSKQILWYITIPLIIPTVAIIFLLTLADCVRLFPLIYSTTRGGPIYSTDVMVTYLYRIAFDYGELGRGAAIGWIITGVVMLLALMRRYINALSQS